MKIKFFLLLSTLTLLAPAYQLQARNKEHAVTDLFESYRKYEGAECMKVGSLLMSIARIAAETDEELQLLSSIKKVVVMDLQQTSRSVKTRFVRDARRILGDFNGYDLLLEVNDEEDNMNIYVMPDGKGGFTEMILVSFSEPAIIYLKGELSAECISKFIDDNCDSVL